MTTIDLSFNRFGETHHYMEGPFLISPDAETEIEAIASNGTGGFETVAGFDVAMHREPGARAWPAPQ